MKQGAPKTNIIVGISNIFVYLANQEYLILLGLGIFLIITGLFEIKNYRNNKLYLTITGVIFAIFLILTYIQLSSPLYQGNRLFNYLAIILFSSVLIIGAYDFTHNYKLSKMQIKDQKPLIRYGVPIIGSIVTLCIIIWLAYYLKILT